MERETNQDTYSFMTEWSDSGIGDSEDTLGLGEINFSEIHRPSEVASDQEPLEYYAGIE